MTPAAIIYWDSSAVLSALLTEIHSQDARQKLEIADATHIVSSLVWAEVFAVLARMERDGHQPATPAAARLALARGPWEYTPAAPDREHLRSLAQRWALRGADLWHLALAATMRPDMPGLQFLSYDRRLDEAAHGEGWSARRP